MHRDQLQNISPVDEPSLDHYKQIMEPAVQRTLQTSRRKAAEIGLEEGQKNKLISMKTLKPRPGHKRTWWFWLIQMGRFPLWIMPENGWLGRQFLDAGFDVMAFNAVRAANSNQSSILFTTTTARVCRKGCVIWFPSANKSGEFARASEWCSVQRSRRILVLLAAPAADAVIADCCQLDVSDDQTLLDSDLFCPAFALWTLLRERSFWLRPIPWRFSTCRPVSRLPTCVQATVSGTPRRSCVWNPDPCKMSKSLPCFESFSVGCLALAFWNYGLGVSRNERTLMGCQSSLTGCNARIVTPALAISMEPSLTVLYFHNYPSLSRDACSLLFPMDNSIVAVLRGASAVTSNYRAWRL